MKKQSRPTLLRHLEPVTDLSEFFREEDTLENSLVNHGTLVNSHLKDCLIDGSHLRKTDLSNTKIDTFSMSNCIIDDCTFIASQFPDSSWHMTEMTNSRCSGIQLSTSTIRNVRFKHCKLDLANFRFAKLSNVIFEECVVEEMDFYGASLKNVSFIDCELDKVEFSTASLQQVDLTEARIVSLRGIPSLKGAIITNEQLIYLAPYFAAEFGIKIQQHSIDN